MYTLSVRRDFIARHHLIGGDWGPENLLHSHHYVLELRLQGPDLDGHGYLVDIVDVETDLAEVISHFREQTLNDLPEFSGLNPSLEHFSRLLATSLNERIAAPNLRRLEVFLWENEAAWAAYSLDRLGS